MKSAYIFLAQGFEEVEALLPCDLLRRADIDVRLVAVDDVATEVSEQESSSSSVQSLEVCGSHGICVKADMSISDIDSRDTINIEAIILPGGLPGSDNLAASEKLRLLIKQQLVKRALLVAICAAPARVLGPHGFLDNKKFTCYPGAEHLVPRGDYQREQNVVVDENIITSQGLGTAANMAHAIIEYMRDKETADKIWNACLLHRSHQ